MTEHIRIVRKATLSDLAAIQASNLKLFQYEHQWHKTLNLSWTFGKEGTNYFRWRIQNPQGVVFVCEDDEEIVGYIAGGIIHRPFRTEAKAAEVENMYVEEPFQRKGVGGMLMEHFFTWCREKGVEVIKVEAVVGNAKARNFYQKFGFLKHNIVLERKL